MNFNAKTKICDILKKYSFLVDFFPTLSLKFKNLKNPIIRKTLWKDSHIGHDSRYGWNKNWYP
jgi:hypothetical protein